MLLAALLSSGTCFGAVTLTLGWAADNIDALAGYRVYQGSTSQTYDTVSDVGAATNITVTGLQPGTTYYFTVTDYDTNGMESLFATELSYTVPSLTPTLSIALNQINQVVLSGFALPGNTYDVQVCPGVPSTQSTDWTVIGSITAGADLSFQFTDPVIPTNATRCYRLRLRQTGA